MYKIKFIPKFILINFIPRLILTLTTYKKNKWIFCWFFRDNNLLWQMSSPWGSQKLFQGLVPHEFAAYLSVSDLFLTQLIMVILSKSCKPGNLESHNSLKFNFTNIRGLRSNFVECKSFLELSYHDILAPCETNADDWIDFGNLSVGGRVRGVILRKSGKILLLVCMVLQLMWRRDFFSHETYL